MTEPTKWNFSGRLVEIDWTEESLPVIHCPISGQPIASGIDPASAEAAPGFIEPNWAEIGTVDFIYYAELNEFTYIRADLRDAIQKAMLDSSEYCDTPEDSDIFDALQEGAYELPSSSIVFEVTTHGMSVGPISSTVWAGVNLSS